jgi:hypothetical protein
MSRRVALIGALAILLVGGAAQGARTTAPSNTSPPTISGTAMEGETLTASSGSWSGSPTITFAYRWQRCNSSGGNCSNTSVKTQTYKLSSGDVDHTMRVSVTATNNDGTANAVSNATAVVVKGKAPQNTALPTISGTAKDGETLTAGNGTWANNPTSFDYQWRRCNGSGGNCKDIGKNKNTYQLVTADVGNTIRVDVKAKNQFGNTTATSAPTAAVAAKGPLPANTSLPTISGSLTAGSLLTAGNGSWTNSPTRFDYRWMRCDTGGNNCNTVGDNQTQRLGSGDVGHTMRVLVIATNQYGEGRATSAASAVVTSGLPSGAIKLPSGELSFPIDQVSLPQRLIVSGVKFNPSRLTSRSQFTGRFRVTDTRGYVIRGALVYAIGLPYGWVRNAAEIVTGTDGWAQITFTPTRAMPLRRSAIVFFVRARKPGDSLLAGVSTRRLVQVRIG